MSSSSKSNDNFAASKKNEKYCCDPFKEHSTNKSKDLRNVSEAHVKKHPRLVSSGQKICSSCRKRLMKLQCESDEEPMHDDSSDDTPEHDLIEKDNEFTSAEHELETLNRSLEIIGVSPLKRHRVNSIVSYPATKKKEIQNVISTKINAACSSNAQAQIDDELSSDDEFSQSGKILQSLIDRYKESNSRSDRITILTIFAKTWSRRKLMEKFECSQRMATQAKHLAIEKGVLSKPIPKPGKSLASDTVSMVLDFYNRDDISRLMPGKKDCVSVSEGGKKIKAQKRLILGNLKEIYRKFKDDHPDERIGFSKFAMLRPKHCVLAGSSGTHSVCVCTIHNNVKLMMNCSMMEKATSEEDVPMKHYSHALAKIMCNPFLPACHLGTCINCPGTMPLRDMLEKSYEAMEVDDIEFKQWTSTDRSNLESKILPLDEFLDCFIEKLVLLKRHDFISKQQAYYLNERKDSLTDGEFLVIGDFAENFSFVVQDEAQSFHWNNNSATIHPFVYYFKEHGQLKHGNFVLISDCNTHDTVAVHVFQKYLMLHLAENFQLVRNVIYFSDGCAGQYKNLKNFSNLCLHKSDFGVPAEWHFFATSHGRGPSDGIGGTVKREATRASLQRPYKDQILSPKALFEFVDTSIKGITAAFVTTDEIVKERSFLASRFEKAKTIAGTQKLHSFHPVSATTLSVKEYSNSSISRIASVSKNEKLLETKNVQGYVAVEYSGSWWVAYVAQFTPESNEVLLHFLHPNGPNPTYVFPDVQDVLTIDATDVLVTLSPTTVTGRTYFCLSRKPELLLLLYN